jgi:hypothetical protein
MRKEYQQKFENQVLEINSLKQKIEELELMREEIKLLSFCKPLFKMQFVLQD